MNRNIKIVKLRKQIIEDQMTTKQIQQKISNDRINILNNLRETMIAKGFTSRKDKIRITKFVNKELAKEAEYSKKQIEKVDKDAS